MTHDIYQTEHVINKFFLKMNLKHNIIIKSNNVMVVEFYCDNIDKDLIDVVMTLFNNLGYFPSFIFVENKNISNEYLFDYNKLIKDLNKKLIHIKFTLESTFDEKIENNYDYLYHVTRLSYIDKIKEKGLIATSEDKITYHPSRIYLCFKIEKCYQLIERFKKHDILNPNKYIDSKIKKGFDIPFYDFAILKINNSDITLYKDPNFSESGCYTYDNIPPNDIEIIKKK